MQHFFVNNRYIKTRSGAAALTEAYKNSMMVGRYPACVLFMEVQPALVDVNVHPAKTEVRFSDERKVFDAIYYAAKNAIAADKTRPTVALHTPTADRSVLRPPQPQAEQLRMPVTPAASAQAEKTPVPAAPKPEFSTATYSAPKAAQTSAPQASQNANPTPAQLHAYETLLKDSAEASYGAEEDLPDLSVRTAGLSAPTKAPEVPAPQTKAEPAAEITQDPETPAAKKDIEFKLIGEAFKAYIFVECEGKLLIIDKHAAHERMLFNALKKDNGKLGAQMLLSPVTVTLSKEEYAVLTEHMDVLRDAGFEAEDFGEGAVLVRACPLNLETEDITALITEIAGYLLKNRREVLSEKLDWVYHSIACRAAIKAGMDTTEYELRDFTAKLLAQDDIRYCPHGRPVLIELSKNELDKQFGRIQ
jgi:DNA mismatch repair protein MutL